MSVKDWTCFRCGQRDFIPGAADDRAGVCGACSFAYPAPAVADSARQLHHATTETIDGRHWPGVRDDRYRVVRVLGSGAQARILLAVHLPLDQLCVLKLLPDHPDFKDISEARLRTEARSAARVSHPNVARFLDCDHIDDVWVYALEHVSGLNLRQMVAAIGRFCWQQANQVGAAIADGLDAVHAQAIIHRDIKPGNIMLTMEGNPKILDLGLVKTGWSDADMTLTQNGQILGTPYYMPPEQFDPEPQLTAQADIYALGATLYYLLTARPPHEGQSVIDLASRHRHDRIVWPDDVSPVVPDWLKRIVETCLAKRPEHRFPSAAALADALRNGDAAQVPILNAEPLSEGIVVASLHNQSRRDDDDWIGDAVADFVGHRLLEAGGLHVVDRHSYQQLLSRLAFDSADAPGPDELLDVAAKLGAATVLSGSFQRNGDALRITLRSVRREPTDLPPLAVSVSGTLQELFSLEDDLADKVLDAMPNARLTESTSSRSRIGTDNLKAHEKFVRGKRAFSDGNYHAAIALADEALQLDGDYIDAVSLIGAAHARCGEYDRAMEYHRREEAAARRDSDPSRLAEALGNIGVMHYYKGQYALAYDFLEQACELGAKQSSQPDLAKYQGNLGFVLMRLNRDKEAEQAFTTAIDISRKFGDLVALAGPYNGMGNLLLRQRRYTEAGEYYRRALALADEIGDRVNVGICHMNLGRCAAQTHDFAEAEARFDDALSALQSTDFWNGLTMVYEHMAEMYLQEGDTAAALSAIDRRLELARKHDNQRMEAQAWEQKAKAHELANNRDEAVHCLKQSLEIAQRPAPGASISHYLHELTQRTPTRAR